MEKEKILYYIGRISPKAREFVDEFYEGVTVLFEVKEQDNEGVSKGWYWRHVYILCFF